MLYGHEYAAGFALGGGGHAVFDCQTHDVNWCIVHEVVVFVHFVANYEPCLCAELIFTENELSVIYFADEDHVTCVIPEGAVWVLVEILHEHLDCLIGVLWWYGLFGCDFIECCFDARIDLGIINKGTGDGLDAAGTNFV